MTHSQETIQAFVAQGRAIAKQAASDMYAKIGERDACGFGWVDVYVDRTNSKEAKALIAAGFRRDYKPKCLTMWDPAGLPTQSISVKEAGAEAMAEHLRMSLGLRAYASSKMD